MLSAEIGRTIKLEAHVVIPLSYEASNKMGAMCFMCEAP
jgi:hypothetical protein